MGSRPARRPSPSQRPHRGFGAGRRCNVELHTMESRAWQVRGGSCRGAVREDECRGSGRVLLSGASHSIELPCVQPVSFPCQARPRRPSDLGQRMFTDHRQGEWLVSAPRTVLPNETWYHVQALIDLAEARRSSRCSVEEANAQRSAAEAVLRSLPSRSEWASFKEEF